jgi:hypothetical protein
MNPCGTATCPAFKTFSLANHEINLVALDPRCCRACRDIGRPFVLNDDLFLPALPPRTGSRAVFNVQSAFGVPSVTACIAACVHSIKAGDPAHLRKRTA